MLLRKSFYSAQQSSNLSIYLKRNSQYLNENMVTYFHSTKGKAQSHPKQRNRLKRRKRQKIKNKPEHVSQASQRTWTQKKEKF